MLHGLNGHPLRSFIPTNKDSAKPDQQTWLVDKLLRYSPEGSRIMTFGYRSDEDLDGVFSPCGIRRTAIRLLDEIIAKRGKEHQVYKTSLPTVVSRVISSWVRGFLRLRQR